MAEENKMLILGFKISGERTPLFEMLRNIRLRPGMKVGLAATPEYLDKALKTRELEEKIKSGKQLSEAETEKLSSYVREIDADFRALVKKIIAAEAKPVALNDEKIVKQTNLAGKLVRLGAGSNFLLVDEKLVEELKKEFKKSTFTSSMIMFKNAVKGKVDVAIMSSRHMENIRSVIREDAPIEFKKI